MQHSRLVSLGLVLWFAAFLQGCVTTSAAQSNASFTSDDEFRRWFAFYYQEPHPEQVTAALNFMDKQGYLSENSGGRDMAVIASVFLARVFAENQLELKAWTDSWGNLNKKQWYVVMISLWMTGTEEGKALVKANLSHVDPEHQDRLKQMLDRDPETINPLTAEVVDARQINLIWAAFSATGDERYVQKVVSYVHYYGEDDEVRHEIGEAAIMTLANNTMLHETVARICADANDKSPDPKTRALLNAMLAALDQLTQQGKLAPAH